mgnify:CR=1 FL=1
MREFLTFLTAVVILAAAQTLATALGIVLLIFVLMGVVAFPRRTFQLIASLGLLALALKAPVVCAGALGAVAIAVVLFGREKKHRTLPAPARLLAPNREL